MPEIGLAVSITAAPLQVMPSLFLVPDVSAMPIVGLGKACTVTEAETDAAQLVVELVTVTV